MSVFKRPPAVQVFLNDTFVFPQSFFKIAIKALANPRFSLFFSVIPMGNVYPGTFSAMERTTVMV